jgi:serine/threonine protein kinase
MNFEFLGPYRVEEILGQGGMGTVYRGIHAKSDERVALKVIATPLADQERFRRRFAAEVETLKRLKHANIVQLIGYGEEQGHLFYSMEYVAGLSLSETIRAIKRLPWNRAIEIAIEIVSALRHAHDLGIIHRDLKPANVMLNEAGHVKLTDFGIAKLFGSTEITAAGSLLGTADYMPPEQAEGKPVTARSDLYALGALIYAMITGRSPHAAKTIPEVLYNVRYTIPRALDLAEPSTPKELAELVAHLLQKEMTERPPTALVVSNRLQSLHHGLQKRQLMDSDSILDQAEQSKEFNSIELDRNDSTDLKTFPGTSESHTHFRLGQESLFHREPTLEAPLSNATSPTSAAEKPQQTEMSLVEEAAPAGKTRFTIVEEKDRKGSTFSADEVEHTAKNQHWFSVVGLSLLLLACIGTIVYYTRPPSKELLYARITEAVESGSDDAILAVEPDIEAFQHFFPNDERNVELAKLRKEIEQQRTVRRLTRQSRSSTSDGAMALIEQAFLECQKTERDNPIEALHKWNAFLVVFSRSKQLTDRQSSLLDLATESVAKLSAEGQIVGSHSANQLQTEIDFASAGLQGKKREEYFRSIIELYADKPWAAKVVDMAKKEVEGF